MKIVVAIDFGTCGTGYGFYEIPKEMKEITSNEIKKTISWPHAKIEYPKTKTCLIYTSKEVNFGHKAVDKYQNSDDKESLTFHECFKIDLLRLSEEKSPNKEGFFFFLTLELSKYIDVTGDYLSKIKEHIFKDFNDHKLAIQEKEIQWVFSIPSHSNEIYAKYLKRSILKAGINTYDKELVVKESEAAGMYCLNEKDSKLKTKDKIMVVDIGGGTIDVTCYQIIKSKLHEIAITNGDYLGSNCLNQNFEKFLSKTVGNDTWESLKKNYSFDHFELMQSFEEIKIDENFSYQESKYIKVYQALKSELIGKDGININVRFGMKLDENILREIFEPVIADILNFLQEFYNDVKKLDHICLVGGFSNNPILQNRIKEKFNNVNVFVPKNTGSCVIDGSVLMGLRNIVNIPSAPVVVNRRSKYTYGIDHLRIYNSLTDRHLLPFAKSIRNIFPDDITGDLYLENCFKVFIKKNEDVKVDEVITEKFHLNWKENFTVVSIYRSENQNASFTTEKGVTKIGEIKILNKGHEKDEILIVKMKIGESILSVSAHTSKSNIKIECEFENN